MSYQKQLQEHYKEVKKRLWGRPPAPVIIKPKALPPPSAPCHTRNTLPPSPPPGLLSESEEKAIVQQALNYTSQERYQPFMGGRTRAQEDRFKDELRLSPRLPPIAGLNLNEPGAIRWQRILHAIARQHGVKAEEILSPCRRKDVIRARHEICYRLRIELCFSYEKIAKLMKRDHTSVIHGVYKVRDRLLDEQSKARNDGGPAIVYHPTIVGHTHQKPVGSVPK
jgi:hypothetical protein